MHGNSFFNPYMYQPYHQSSNLMRGLGNMNNMSNFSRTASGIANTNTGLNGIKGLLGKFSFSGLLDGASKTLNVVNQAIPIFYQVKPIINNAKTMFRIIGAVKSDDNASSRNVVKKEKNNTNNIKTNHVSSTSNASTTNYENFNEENPMFFI